MPGIILVCSHGGNFPFYSISVPDCGTALMGFEGGSHPISFGHSPRPRMPRESGRSSSLVVRVALLRRGSSRRSLSPSSSALAWLLLVGVLLPCSSNFPVGSKGSRLEAPGSSESSVSSSSGGITGEEEDEEEYKAFLLQTTKMTYPAPLGIAITQQKHDKQEESGKVLENEERVRERGLVEPKKLSARVEHEEQESGLNGAEEGSLVQKTSYVNFAKKNTDAGSGGAMSRYRWGKLNQQDPVGEHSHWREEHAGHAYTSSYDRVGGGGTNPVVQRMEVAYGCLLAVVVAVFVIAHLAKEVRPDPTELGYKY